MSKHPPTPETSALTSQDAAGDFRCGKEPLDRFFHTQATQNQRRGISRTWVLRRSSRDQADLPAILGFYTLAVGSIERTELPAVEAKRLPHYPIPIVLIARLARDERTRGLGIGERLLRDAHLRALAVESQANAYAVVVDAKDTEAVRFYEKFGYEQLEASPSGWPQRMMLAMKTLRDSLGR